MGCRWAAGKLWEVGWEGWTGRGGEGWALCCLGGDRGSCHSWVTADHWDHSEDRVLCGDKCQNGDPIPWVPRDMKPRPGNKWMKAPARVLGPLPLRPWAGRQHSQGWGCEGPPQGLERGIVNPWAATGPWPKSEGHRAAGVLGASSLPSMFPATAPPQTCLGNRGMRNGEAGKLGSKGSPALAQAWPQGIKVGVEGEFASLRCHQGPRSLG